VTIQLSPMRVLFITGEYPPVQGGVGDCTAEIAKGLSGLGVEPHILTTAEGSGMVRQADQSPTGLCQGDIHVHRLVGKWNWSSLRLAANTARGLAPDIVHIQYQTGAFGMHPAINFLPRYIRSRTGDVRRHARAGAILRPCAITTFHDLKIPYLFPKAGPVRSWVNRDLARSSDAAIATNEEDYLRLQSWGAVRIAMIPIGSNIPIVPPPGYEPAEWRAHLGVGQDEILLSYFGFLNASKGGETLIRALAQIPSAKLLMVGGQVGASDQTNARYLARVRSLSAELELTPRILWTGFTPAEKVSANLLASDICVLPYRDGASFRRGSLMAALAHGLPIVTTYSVSGSSSPGFPSYEPEDTQGVSLGLPELRDGENVLLVPPDDPRAVAEAVERLVSLPDLRARVSRGALELAQHFKWDNIVGRHLDLYKLLLSSAARSPGPSPRKKWNSPPAN
jgi:glycosyltransferase involved in cell wall biosynthesis